MSNSIFPETHWSAVLAAAGTEPDKARRAFEQLCGEYRHAIVHWMRLQGLSPEDAEDAAHDFLEQWLQRENPLRHYVREECPFRAFLRVCLRQFLIDWRERLGAAKRGGGVKHKPLEEGDWVKDGSNWALEVDFAVATQIHQDVIAKLGNRWKTKVAGPEFERLHAIALGNAENPGYGVLAKELGATVAAVKAWIYRFRREYHAAFREAVSRQTEPASIDEDVLHLHKALLQPPSTEQKRISDSVQPQPPSSR